MVLPRFSVDETSSSRVGCLIPRIARVSRNQHQFDGIEVLEGSGGRRYRLDEATLPRGKLVMTCLESLTITRTSGFSMARAMAASSVASDFGDEMVADAAIRPEPATAQTAK